MKSFYNEWGFSNNPFDTRQLMPNEMGEKLLACRENELTKLIKSLNITTKWICIDGGIGQGKTSLANVAIFKQMKDYLTSKKGRFLIPCEKPIELDASKSAPEIRKDVLRSIAKTLLAKDKCGNSEILKYCTFEDKSQIKALFEKPFFTGAGITIGPLGVSKELSPNESQFYEDRLYETIESWLDELYEANGAVVCVIDNLELIGLASTEIAARLEQLRDSLLTQNGVLWVLCGANGSVQGMASTRINSYLKKPALIIDPIENIQEVIAARRSYFGPSAYFPLADADLQMLDKLMSHVLRECLGYIGNYCEWVFENDLRPITEQEKQKCFVSWLEEMSLDSKRGLERVAEKKAWTILEKGYGKKKFIALDYAEFDYSQQTNFSTDISHLVENGLLEKSKSVDDGRVIEYSLSPKARIALYKYISSPD